MTPGPTPREDRGEDSRHKLEAVFVKELEDSAMTWMPLMKASRTQSCEEPFLLFAASIGASQVAQW